MDFTEINSRGKRKELLGRIDRQNSLFRTAKTTIIKFGLHASFVELESSKSALNEVEIIKMGRTYLLKNSSGRSPLTDGKMPCLLRYDWSRPIIAESGRGKGLGRSENKRPETRRSWN
ncbi:uncharacterized protein TNCV_2066011 [Trichonephila clavipes]|nr:uncharacterized protein TNCV_2066011 [Trichonephila clavipes]